MRTTLTIDSDVAAKTKAAVRRTGRPFKAVINEALRLGLDALMTPRLPRPYVTNARPMGLRPGLSYDNISELLDRGEGEHHA